MGSILVSGVIMRKAFTLLELLAVIAIITLLIGVLLPAVQGVREAGRRTQCINRQRNLAVALLNYENTRGSLPGWRDFITVQQGGNQVAAQASWIYCILPHIEQTSLYDQLKAGQVITPIPPMPLLHCPSLEEGPQGRGTHYVVNGGAVDDFSLPDNLNTVDNNIANGPFLDRASLIANDGSPKYRAPYFDESKAKAAVRATDISKMDGTAYTLMTSENCQRGYWISEQHTHFFHDPGKNFLSLITAPDEPFTFGQQHYIQLPDKRWSIPLISSDGSFRDNIEGSVAFCWPRVYPTGQPPNPQSTEMPLITYPLSSEKDGTNMYQGFTGAQAVANPPSDPVYGNFTPISRNPYNEAAIPVYLNLFNRKTFLSSWYHSARPSSMHVGVFIASFCDGNVRRLSTDMNEMTFVQLMTISDAQSDAGRALPAVAGQKNFLEGQLFDPGVL